MYSSLYICMFLGVIRPQRYKDKFKWERKSGKKNVILGTLMKYSLEQILPFFNSLIQANFSNCDVVIFIRDVDIDIIRYLKRIGRLDLYENKSNQICFLFSGLRLRYGDQTPIEEFFKGAPNPKVVVNDVNSMFGG